MGGKERQSCIPDRASDWEISVKGRMCHSMFRTTKNEGAGMRTVTEYVFGVLLSVLGDVCIYQANASPVIA